MNSNKKKIISIWLYSGLILVVVMVVIGGITRLTHSGLSMVEWKLIGGTIPPLNETDWQEAFTKYQQFPEYQKINKEMSLTEFKVIFFWEYLHRLLGRIIGLVFIIPFLLFWKRKWLDKKLKKQLIVLLLAWWVARFFGLVYGAKWFSGCAGSKPFSFGNSFNYRFHINNLYLLVDSRNGRKREIYKQEN